MDYKELAQKIVDELYKAEKEHKIYQYTMYYWMLETTEELARILEEIDNEQSANPPDGAFF